MEVILMDDSKRDPREDISLIRQMLERTVDGLQTVAPWVTGLGVVWLIYGALSAIQRLVARRASLSLAIQLSRAGAIAGYLFCLILAVGFLVCRRKSAQLDSDSLARKLIDMWGVCIFLFSGMTILLNPVIQIFSIRLGFSTEAAASLNKACALCRSFLLLLLPVTPILITAGFLNNFRMRMAGIILAVLTASVLCSHALLLFGEGAGVKAEWQFLWLGAVCLLDLAPGTILLVFGRQLKRR